MEKRSSTKKILFVVMAAMLVAMEVVLSRFLSINLWNMKLGFAFVPVMLAGYLLGPVGGAAVAMLSDIVGAMLFPSGAFFPGFTVTATLTGLIFGLCFYKKMSFPRVLIAVLSTQLINGLLINTLWIHILYHSPYLPLLVSRIPQICGMIVVETVFAQFVVPRFKVIKEL